MFDFKGLHLNHSDIFLRMNWILFLKLRDYWIVNNFTGINSLKEANMTANTQSFLCQNFRPLEWVIIHYKIQVQENNAYSFKTDRKIAEQLLHSSSKSEIERYRVDVRNSNYHWFQAFTPVLFYCFLFFNTSY